MVSKYIKDNLTRYFNDQLYNMLDKSDNKLSEMSEKERISYLMELSQLPSLKHISESNIKKIIKEALTFNNGNKPSQDLKNTIMFFAIAVDTATHGRLDKVAYSTLRNEIDTDGVSHQLTTSVFNITQINTDESLGAKTAKRLCDIDIANKQLIMIDRLPSHSFIDP